LVKRYDRIEQKEKGEQAMADRKAFFGEIEADPDLEKMLEESRPVTEEELREQRISFAFGNAPANATSITKESVRLASEHISLKR
jgi:hypothetical protein